MKKQSTNHKAHSSTKRLGYSTMLFVVLTILITVCSLLLGLFVFFAMYWQNEAPTLQLFDSETAPHVHVSMTTIPERFASPWFAKNIRAHMNHWGGNFTLWCNIPPSFKDGEEPYIISKHVEQLLNDFPETFRLYFCSKDWGPITKILGSVENPAIGIDDRILVIDDDIHYQDDIVLFAATYTSYDPSLVYTFCKPDIRGYLGWATTKRQCLDIPNNRPPSCFRIDDDLLTEYFSGRMSVVPYRSEKGKGGKKRGFYCTHCDNSETPHWKRELKHDFRLPMQIQCRKDFRSKKYEKTNHNKERGSGFHNKKCIQE